jgi:CheY-like chemotaxis protein
MHAQTRPTILCIDDASEDLRDLGAALVKHFNLKVSTQARKGFERAQAVRPDLILLDVSMPTMDGFAVCRLLKANPLTRSIPVIFVTSNNDIENRLEGFRLLAILIGLTVNAVHACWARQERSEPCFYCKSLNVAMQHQPMSCDPSPVLDGAKF